MRIFLAGAGHNKANERFKDYRASKLLSYFNVLERKSLKSRRKFITTQAAFLGKGDGHSQCELMLDSGAYSAWTRNIEIDIVEYADFILQNRELIDYVINLDVIPGGFGRSSSALEIVESAEKGWSNLKYLEKRGIDATHVFHQGEDLEWLHKLIDNYEYFGISPAEDRTTKEKAYWLDSIMKYLTDKDGYPIRKFHGFGVTAVDLLFRYPWYTVDSTTWMLLSAYGKVIIPKISSSGEVDFAAPPHHVCFTRKPRATKPALVYDRLTNHDKREVQQWLSCLDDIDLEKFSDVKVGLVERLKANIQYFVKLEQIPVIPWKRTTGGFF